MNAPDSPDLPLPLFLRSRSEQPRRGPPFKTSVATWTLQKGNYDLCPSVARLRARGIAGDRRVPMPADRIRV